MSIKDDFLVWLQDIEAQVSNLQEENNSLRTKLVKPPLWGVNAHMFNSRPYANSKVVAGMIYSLKMNSVRLGVFVEETGVITGDIDAVYMDMLMCGIQISPMLHVKSLTITTADLQGQYNIGYRIGSGFAQRYGHIFSTIEIGNELSLKCLLPGKSGKDIGHYDQGKLAAIASYVKGINEGIKSTAPWMITIINGEWLHFGFHKLLEEVYKVRTDILAWHWYTNQDDDIKKNPGYNEATLIEDELAKTFPGRKIIFNEVGYTPTKAGYSSEQQSLKLLPLLARLKGKGYDVYLYELLDEPDRTGNEATYGIYDSKFKPKLIVEGLKAL